MSREPETIYVLCMLADAAWTVTDASFDHFCFVCGKRLMVAPSSQAFLKAHPEAKTVCFCQLEKMKSRGDTAGILSSAVGELKRVVPNLRRRRN